MLVPAAPPICSPTLLSCGELSIPTMPHFLLQDLLHHEKLEGRERNYNCKKISQVWIQHQSRVLGPYREQLDSILGSDGPGEAKI